MSNSPHLTGEIIYAFSNYREYLKSMLDGKKIKGGQQALAKAMGCQPAYFSRVLKGSASLSFEQAILLGQHLKLSEFEIDYLIALVGKERSGINELSHYWDNKIRRIENLYHPDKQQAAEKLGGYTKKQKSHLEGWYRCVRPLFADENRFEIYYTEIKWDESCSSLVFKERRKGLCHEGQVYSPGNMFFIYLLTIELGAVRLVTFSEIPLEDSSDIYSALSLTIANPQQNSYTPAACHTLMQKGWQGPVDDTRYVEKTDPDIKIFLPYFKKYQDNRLII